MHRVLAIPELLDTIFRIMDDSSNFNNALVCRKWSEFALDALWRKVSNLYRLFNLLAPLRKAESGQFDFSRLPESSDWVQFERYAKRVRELAYDADEPPYFLNQSVFDDIARTRLTLAILPNMHTLSWKAAIPLCVMFMHPGVKRFIIHLPDFIIVSSPRPFFHDITARMPSISHLDIRTKIPMNAFEDEALHLLTALPKLQKVILPRFLFTTRVAECLSKHSKLGSIEFQYFDEQGAGEPLDIEVFRPELSEGAFLSLWDLSMVTTYSDARRFLTISFAPSNLTMLYVESPNLETPDAMQALITAVSENCQLLKLLALISPRKRTGLNPLPIDDAPKKINMETLKPLFSCSNLTSLDIIHKYPIDLTQEDLEILALRWPSLETLTLNNEPLEFDSSPLTFEALFPFARHCPRLTHLGLFIDASPNTIPTFSPTSPFPSFKSLHRLSMGLSIITVSVPVALFLSQILPLDCGIDSGVIWEETFEVDAAISNMIGSRFDLWEAANTLVPILTTARVQEREKAKEMKRELDDLQIRTRILMEKFGNMVNLSEACVLL